MNSPYFLKQIRLFQFKNYQEKIVSFIPTFNAIVGNNGMGKTNLLDAIYCSCFTKSHFANNESTLIKIERDVCKISTQFIKNDVDIEVDFLINNQNKKEIFVNQQIIKKHSEHLGALPVIMVSPDEIELINGTADIRRNFLDKFISQTNQQYLNDLINYKKLIQQKKALLKNWHNQPQKQLLDIYNNQIEPFVQTIYQTRKKQLVQLFIYTNEFYKIISNDSYTINFKYDSQLNNTDWKTLCVENFQKEITSQRSIIGVHKDELIFELSPFLFKDNASQGQKKSLLFALKLASLEFIANEKKIFPILLLDDIFEKLDENRIEKLFQILQKFNPIQVFLTDVNKNRLENIFKKLNINCHYIEL